MTDVTPPQAPGPSDEPAPDRTGAELPLEQGAIPGDVLGMLLGAPVRYSSAEVAAAARMTLDEVGRLWRAMGFPDVGSATAFTDADLAALLRISALMERGLLDLDSVVDIVRSFGQTTSRLAEWQLDTVSRYLVRQEEQALVGDEQAERADRTDWEGRGRDQLAELLPEFELLLGYVWRRQLTASLGRVFDDFDGPADVADIATVGFADLVSFTRLSRQLDQDSLAMLVQTFETAAADVVYAAGGRLVKTLGDEVMFVSDSAPVAAEIGLRLHDLPRGDADLPQMRIGLATGAVLMRMGDVFGTTVNRASRLTATARPGTTLMDAATSEALFASQDDRFSSRAQTPRPIRGFGLIRPYALTRGARRLDDRGPRGRESQANIADGSEVQAAVTGSASASTSSGSAGKT